MMPQSLEQQMQQLIVDAPQDGKTPQAMAAIAPILLQVAQQFGQSEYYILQSIQQNWQITTLQNRTQPDLTKTVIYGYAELKDATQAGRDPNLMAQAIPALDLLFQFISLPNINSLILLERQSGETQSLEIHQSELKQLIQKQLQATFHPEDSSPDQTVHLA
jgi:hypothetical protein